MLFMQIVYVNILLWDNIHTKIQILAKQSPIQIDF